MIYGDWARQEQAIEAARYHADIRNEIRAWSEASLHAAAQSALYYARVVKVRVARLAWCKKRWPQGMPQAMGSSVQVGSSHSGHRSGVGGNWTGD